MSEPLAIGIGILPDPADPTRYTVGVSQAGLGMPRDYYLLEGEKYDAFRTAYKSYIERLLTLAGVADPAAKAGRIYALEAAMAKVHWEPARSRDIQQVYNVMDRARMAALAPQYDWPLLLKESGYEAVPNFVVGETSAIAGMGKMIETVSLSTWKDYLAFQFVSDHAAYLPKAFDQANFAFFGKTCATCRSSASGGSAASGWSTARSARPSARFMSSDIIRPRAPRGWAS